MDTAFFSFEGDREVANAAWREAWGRARAVRNIKDTLGLTQMVKSYDLPGGEQVYVVDLEHVRAVHIVAPVVSQAPARPQPFAEQRYAGVGVADYVCGKVTDPRLVTESMLDPEGGPDLRVHRLAGLTLTETGAARLPLDLARTKLAVPESASFAPVQSAPSLVQWSQYRSLSAGYYSGEMRRLVQLLLGVGNQQQETWERRWAAATGAGVVLQEVDANTEVLLEGARSAFGLYREDAPPVPVPVRYDYRANRTHGLSWGADGRCYVVEIGARGVLVWPLALDPVSLTESGRARYQALYPELFETTPGAPSLFARLGGFPTGAAPPQTPKTLEDLIRAGEIVRAGDCSAAYGDTAWFSSALGWAFHPDGGEAHNCCYRVGADGLRIGIHFAVQIVIGALKTEPAAPPNAGDLIATLALTEGWETRKVGRMTAFQVAECLAAGEGMRAAFDAVTVPASFAATAILREQKRGPLYHPGKLRPTGDYCAAASSQPQFKFWEPMVDGLVSFDFGLYDPQTGRQTALTDPPVCDTPMFVCWDRSGVFSEVCYWWADQPDAPGEPVHTREECQFEGSWTDSEPARGPKVCGNFYSNHWDGRRTLADGGRETVTTGTFCGNTDFVQFTAMWGMCCTIRKEFWYAFASTWRAAQNHTASVALVWPHGDRSIYLTAELDAEAGVTEGETVTAPAVVGTGNVIRWGIIFDFVWHWREPCDPGDGGPVSCLLREVLPPMDVGSCFDGAPDFPYYSLCGWRATPGTEGWHAKRLGAEPVGPAYETSTTPVNRLEWRVTLRGDTAASGAVVASQTLERPGLAFADTDMSPWWWRASPTACDPPETAQLFLTCNRWGADVMGFQPQFDAPVVWAGEPVALHGTVRCFVGWVT